METGPKKDYHPLKSGLHGGKGLGSVLDIFQGILAFVGSHVDSNRWLLPTPALRLEPCNPVWGPHQNMAFNV